MKKKIVVPICGVDGSMEGSSLDGWEIKKLLPMSEEHTFFDDVTDGNLYNRIHSLLNAMEDIYSVIPFAYDDQNPYYMVLAKETDNPAELQSIVDALRVFKTSQFGCWYPITCKHYQEAIAAIPISNVRSYTTSALQIRPPLRLSIEEQKQVAQLLQKRDNEWNSKTLQKVNTMLQFFHESCGLDNLYLSFITRVTILEMLVPGNAELSYRLRHYVAVLLGRNKEESIEIAKNLKEIYSARSEFLHNGEDKKISDELMGLAYEYSRRVLANLLYISDDLEDIRITLEQAGYGENPYNVTI